MAPGTWTDRTLDADRLWQQHTNYWSSPLFDDLARLRDNHGSFSSLATFLLRHSAMIANNLGTILEDLDRKPEAFQAYEAEAKADAAK